MMLVPRMLELPWELLRQEVSLAMRADCQVGQLDRPFRGQRLRLPEVLLRPRARVLGSPQLRRI